MKSVNLGGRPREFDTDQALERAMRVFWAQGYEGTSLTDLTDALGITRSSMYAAFGNKESLFRKVMTRYAAGPAAYVSRALERDTAAEVAHAFVMGAVEATTLPDSPPGCLSVQGSLAAGKAGAVARDALIAWREDGYTGLRRRFEQAVALGDLPPQANPHLLARYLMTVVNGIAVQATGGVPRSDLEDVAELALRNLPLTS
ncbi:TetR/AcrR family transcriptional regulator [Arthrobacter zhaoguopingii]|uniref:TetR/AcrR family transcriptional regulator n=1 Tax=Arthrobacter zhaoguopingii TaxID=2681491 RepID=UPI001FF0329F|nr:TetR/AcrR family transcriptional regulator [Arthrobacter zhaoguopingii]